MLALGRVLPHQRQVRGHERPLLVRHVAGVRLPCHAPKFSATREKSPQHPLDQAVLKVSRAAGELVAETRDAYFETVAARESVAVAKENVALSRRSLESVRAQVRAGVASRVDENVAHVQALGAELSLTRAEREASVAVRR